MAMRAEFQALYTRIDRALNAIPGLKKHLAAQHKPAVKKPTRTRRKREDQDTQVVQAIQLSFLWNSNQAQGDQDQAG